MKHILEWNALTFLVKRNKIKFSKEKNTMNNFFEQETVLDLMLWLRLYQNVQMDTKLQQNLSAIFVQVYS